MPKPPPSHQPPTAAYLEWCDEVYAACRRDHGYTPYEWIMEISENDEHKARLFASMRGTLQTSYARRVAPNTLSAWLGDNLFGTNQFTTEEHDQ